MKPGKPVKIYEIIQNIHPQRIAYRARQGYNGSASPQWGYAKYARIYKENPVERIARRLTPAYNSLIYGVYAPFTGS
jgi:hypothetical protein